MTSYRIVSLAAATFGVEVSGPKHVPFIAASFNTEPEARAYIARQEYMESASSDWECKAPRNWRD
jgi:hypothetical protein